MKGNVHSTLLFCEGRTLPVEFEHQLRLVEHGVFELLIERDGLTRADIDAELAEHAAPEVVHVGVEHAHRLAFGRGLLPARHVYGAVGAGRLAEPAGDAAVMVVGVVEHRERPAEAGREHELGAVLGVALRALAREELAHGGPQTRRQRTDGAEEIRDITFESVHDLPVKNASGIRRRPP